MKRLLFLTLIATAVLALPICPTQSTTHNDMALTAPNIASTPTQIVASTYMTVGAVLTAMNITPASANASTLTPIACGLVAEFGTKYLWLCAVAMWLEDYNPGD